ncbi:MAG: DUF2019 domain-containing protein [Xanthobacteraceae bacterium]
MMESNLVDLTTEELINRFAVIGVEQDQALLYDEIAKFNRLYDKKEAITNELKRRPDDQRRALLALFDHPNMQTRLNAAKSTLAVAPQAARQMLQSIADSKWYPQAGDAGMCLVNLDRGIFVPK